MRDLIEEQIACYRARAQDAVLELACGTGIWTGELARIGASITAVDAAPEAYHDPAAPAEKLDDLGFEARTHTIGESFFWLSARRRP